MVTVGIVGAAGQYGQWLSQFFREQMQCAVRGHDPRQPDSDLPETLLEGCDVLLFAAPIRHTVSIIGEYVRRAGARTREQLWLDVTSIKAAPVEAMLQSQAEVVGLHPMCAAPKTPSLRGQVLVVCEARLHRWRDWLRQLLHAFGAEVVRATPEHHDQVMALVQGLVHAGHLAQARVLAAQPAPLSGLDALLPFRSPQFALDSAMITRILNGNPAIYEDIQYGNPHVAPVLESLAREVQAMLEQVKRGTDAARGQWREQSISTPRATLGKEACVAGNYRYEQLAYLLADLNEANAITVFLPRDKPGSLRALLAVFADAGINLLSLHSSRNPAGEVHFRLGLDRPISDASVQDAVRVLEQSGIGRRIG